MKILAFLTLFFFSTATLATPCVVPAPVPVPVPVEPVVEVVSGGASALIPALLIFGFIALIVMDDGEPTWEDDE